MVWHPEGNAGKSYRSEGGAEPKRRSAGHKERGTPFMQADGIPGDSPSGVFITPASLETQRAQRK